jgi:hypothetical protein
MASKVEPLITNAQGQQEPFSFEKVYQSAKRVGASEFQAREIAAIIQKEIYPGMKTWEIFGKVKELLEKGNQKSAMRFSLKEAMRKLGPTGYSFEKYIGEIFESIGYKVKLNQFIPGKCVSYEIDFVAEKGDFMYIGECKYHKLPEGKVDLQIALANSARFNDIVEKGAFGKKSVKSILVTNTKLTTEAIKYSECKNIDVLGWRYPAEQGLEYLIESRNLYPLTILPSYKGRLAEIFSRDKKMLVKDIIDEGKNVYCQTPELQKNGIDKAVKEAETLLEK